MEVDAVSATNVVHVVPPFADLSNLYPVTADPPLNAGAVQDNETVAVPGVAARPDGAEGAPTGTTALDV